MSKGNENIGLEVSAAICIQMLAFWSVNLFGSPKLIYDIKKTTFLLLSVSAEHSVFTV